MPQLPLTTLNSVVATCALAKDLFPDKPETGVTPTGVAVSVGAMNLCGLGLGVMPCCHGAGGLAAHYRFGARTGAATAFLGAGKLFLGVVFGGSLLTLLGKFPAAVLGVLLAARGGADSSRAGRRGGRRGYRVDSWYDPGDGSVRLDSHRGDDGGEREHRPRRALRVRDARARDGAAKASRHSWRRGLGGREGIPRGGDGARGMIASIACWVF